MDFETEDRFNLVLMIMCDFCALGPPQRKEILSKFHRILKPGGSVLLDVYSLSAFDQLVGSFFMASLFLCAQAYACGIEGTAVNSDGSKINGSATISTSWYSKKALPKNGKYSLDLGSSVCGETITVYIDSKQGQRVTLKGWTTVNSVRR